VRALQGIEAARGVLREPSVAIGQFDGVHLGHRAVVMRAIEQARRRGADAAVLTFEPHPIAVLAPERAPRRLTSAEEKVRLLGALGVDAVVVQTFDAALAAQTPRAFVAEVLQGALGVREVVVGYDFAFGAGRAGNAEVLRAALAEGPVPATLEVVEAVTVDGQPCKSGTVRALLGEGDVVGAARLLGRAFEVIGPVVEGRRRGRGLGFPTANVDAGGRIVPRAGVYAVRVALPDGAVRGGVCNVGVAPTFGGEEAVRVEAHVFDWEGDLYGREVRVGFVARLRDERAFSGVEALKAQIAEDAAAARRALKEGA